MAPKMISRCLSILRLWRKGVSEVPEEERSTYSVAASNAGSNSG